MGKAGRRVIIALNRDVDQARIAWLQAEPDRVFRPGVTGRKGQPQIAADRHRVQRLRLQRLDLQIIQRAAASGCTRSPMRQPIQQQAISELIAIRPAPLSIGTRLSPSGRPVCG